MSESEKRLMLGAAALARLMGAANIDRHHRLAVV
jgi:hypothetical protein